MASGGCSLSLTPECLSDNAAENLPEKADVRSDSWEVPKGELVLVISMDSREDHGYAKLPYAANAASEVPAPATLLPQAIQKAENVQACTGDIATTVLRVQLALLSCAFVIAFVIGSMAPSRGHVTASMALPEWNDRVQPWAHEVEDFAARVATGFGLRESVALEFSPWILEASSRQNLAPELLAGLVLTESSFRKNVVSPVGAVGPAQVRPEYWSQFCGTQNLKDPAENIYCGAQILAHYAERCGAEACALSAYNIGPYSSTQKAAGKRYVAKVGQWRDRLAEIDSTLEEAGSSPVSAPVSGKQAGGSESIAL